MLFNHIIETLVPNPKKLFLIDGIGAILSALALGLVLVKLEKFFGIPSSALYVLATFPMIFATYDMYCYRKKSDKLGQFLRIIAVINLLYCCLSIGFVFYHFDAITAMGWAYILTEILIIITLATIELRVANQLLQKTT